jgi:hypothetical protein
MKMIVVRRLLIDAGGTVKLGESRLGRGGLPVSGGNAVKGLSHSARIREGPRQPRFTNLARKTGRRPRFAQAEDASAD